MNARFAQEEVNLPKAFSGFGTAGGPPSSTGTSRILDEAFMTASTLKRLVRDTDQPARRTQDRQIVLRSQPARTAPGGGS